MRCLILSLPSSAELWSRGKETGDKIASPIQRSLVPEMAEGGNWSALRLMWGQLNAQVVFRWVGGWGDNNASDQPDPVQETGHHHQLWSPTFNGSSSICFSTLILHLFWRIILLSGSRNQIGDLSELARRRQRKIRRKWAWFGVSVWATMTNPGGNPNKTVIVDNLARTDNSMMVRRL